MQTLVHGLFSLFVLSLEIRNCNFCYSTKTYVSSVTLILTLNLTSMRNIHIKRYVVLNEDHFSFALNWNICLIQCFLFQTSSQVWNYGRAQSRVTGWKTTTRCGCGPRAVPARPSRWSSSPFSSTPVKWTALKPPSTTNPSTRTVAGRIQQIWIAIVALSTPLTRSTQFRSTRRVTGNRLVTSWCPRSLHAPTTINAPTACAIQHPGISFPTSCSWTTTA